MSAPVTAAEDGAEQLRRSLFKFCYVHQREGQDEGTARSRGAGLFRVFLKGCLWFKEIQQVQRETNTLS